MRFFSPSLLALACVGLALPAAADEETVWRLFVADHSRPTVTVIDLGSDRAIGSFEVDSPASLYVTQSKAAVYAVQGVAGQVAAIASGIKIDDHGDHGDIEIAEPQLLAAAVAGDRPVHFVEHDGHLAIFFDGEGVVRMIEENAWLEGVIETRDVATAAPHHGVAVQLGDHLLISEPHPEDPSKLPIGIKVLDSAGAQVGNLHECPDLHGEAGSGNLLAIACATGLLLAQQSAGGPEITFLPYAETLPEGKTTTLLGGTALQYWLGNYGADRVVLIDPSAEEAFRLVELPSRRVHFAIDPQRAKYAYVFTEDGQLRRLDVLSGELTGSLALTEPYSMDGEWSLPRPRVAVAGDMIVVTDPLEGVIHIVDAESFAFERDIPVGGMPYNIVAVGGSGASH